MLQKELESVLARKLSEVNIPADVEVSEFGGSIFADITVQDAETVPIVREIVNDEDAFVGVAFSIHANWTLEQVGPAQVAYASDGAPRAAVLYPITVRSGNRQIVVWVAITKLAEWGFERILGGKPDLAHVARVVIENALKQGGSSSWNPIERDYFEITSDSVAHLSRGLRKTA